MATRIGNASFCGHRDGQGQLYWPPEWMVSVVVVTRMARILHTTALEAHSRSKL